MIIVEFKIVDKLILLRTMKSIINIECTYLANPDLIANMYTFQKV